MADAAINLTPTAPTTTVTAPGGYTVAIATGTVAPSVTFSGPGAFSLDGVTGLLSGYTIAAVNGAVLTVNLLSTLPNTASLAIGAGSTIALGAGAGAASVISAAFQGTGGTLTFAAGLLTSLATPTISGFAAGDHLDLGNAFSAADTLSYSAATGLLTVSAPTGIPGTAVPIGSVHLVGTYTASQFSLAAAVGGGIEIDVACFLPGTLIRTPDGDRPVESLSAGCVVSGADGSPLPVVAVRTRSIDLDAAGHAARPVRFRAGSIAPGVPSRDLSVSPDHSMHLDGVFVPASLLVNGESILRAAIGGTVDYVHVEVEPHAVLIAEGAETESYLDIGHRGHAAIRPGVVALHPAQDPKTWEDSCAPLVLTGPALDAIRARLGARLASWRAEHVPVADAA